jgi:hypothetical protein
MPGAPHVHGRDVAPLSHGRSSWASQIHPVLSQRSQSGTHHAPRVGAGAINAWLDESRSNAMSLRQVLEKSGQTGSAPLTRMTHKRHWPSAQ